MHTVSWRRYELGDVMFADRQRFVMDYPCDKLGDFSFSRFGFYRGDGQTESHTHRRG